MLNEPARKKTEEILEATIAAREIVENSEDLAKKEALVVLDNLEWLAVTVLEMDNRSQNHQDCCLPTRELCAYRKRVEVVQKMPVFTLLGKDKLALVTLDAYRLSCLEEGLVEQAAEVTKAMNEMHDWQKENSKLMKMPDHKHVAVGDKNE